MKLRRLLELGVPTTAGFATGILIAVLQGLSAVALLASSAWLISRASEQPNVVYVSIAVVGVRAFAVGRAAFRYGERMVLHNAAFKLLSAQRPRLLAALIPFAPVATARDSRGQAVQRVVSDVDELQNLSIRVISPLVQSIVVSLIAAGFLALLAPAAGLALLFACLLAAVLALPLATRTTRRSDLGLVVDRATLAERSLDLIENAEVLAAYGWAENALDELRDVEQRLVSKQRRSALTLGIVQGGFVLLSVLATCATAWFGAASVASGAQPGVMLAVFALLPMAVFDVLNGSQAIAQWWHKYRGSAERVLEIVDAKLPAEVPVENPIDASAQPTLDRFESLQFIGVSAKYPGAENAALSDFNLKVSAGERILVSGESGAGKSTIANLILRFLDPCAGELLINGRSASDYSIEAIRTIVGLIEQQPSVFYGTIRQNLLLAKPSATDQELIDALQRVGLWSMAERRGGLDLFVGERAVLLSGGEAARLAMARALLANFQLLILDEPTANLDAVTAEATLRELMLVAEQAKVAVILISHDAAMAALTTSSVVVEKTRADGTIRR